MNNIIGKGLVEQFYYFTFSFSFYYAMAFCSAIKYKSFSDEHYYQYLG